MIELKKKDIYWGYLAQIFSLAAGLITLPIILKLLSAEEIGLNYLLITFGAFVSLMDFGFTPQFSKYISYVFSGTQVLLKNDIEVTKSNQINYKLLATMIKTARYVYFRLTIATTLLLLTLGNFYMYKVTNGFTNIENALFIWLIYCFGICINIYYSYYGSLLQGKGLITESKKAIVYSRALNITLTFLFLYNGLGLMGVVIANVISPFLYRFICHRFFFTEGLKSKIGAYIISKKDKEELFETVWYNAKKIGLVFIGSFAINKLSLFLAGLYLSLSQISSYGLMLQLFGLITMISSTYFQISLPRLSSLRAKGQEVTAIKEFALTMNIYYILFMTGTIGLLLIFPHFLFFINSNVQTPSMTIMVLFAVVSFLEGNHSHFAAFITTKNKVPFVTSSLVAGFCIGLGNYLILSKTDYGIIGLIIVSGLVQASYANWKWPVVILNEFKISLAAFICYGFKELLPKVKTNDD